MSKKPAVNRRAAAIGADGAPSAFDPGGDLESLRESRRMLTGLLGNLPGMVYRCRNDAHWTMEFVSEGSIALTGYAPTDFVGNAVRAYADIIHPDDRERVWGDVQAALAAGRAFCLEYRIHTGSGELKWVWERGQAVLSPDGELLGLEGFVTDVSGRVHAEARVRDSETGFRALLEVSSHWYWELDPGFRFTRFDGPFVERNPALFDPLLGRSPWAAGIQDEGGGLAYREACEARLPLRYLILQMPPKDGLRAYVEISGEPVFASEGAFAGYRGVGRDVTRQRRAELASQRLGRMYAALSGASEASVRARSPEELYRKACDAAVHGASFISAALVLAQPESRWMKVAAAAGVGEAQMLAARISTDASLPEGRGLVGEAFRSRKPATSDDYLHDPRTRPCQESGRARVIISAAAAIPLLQRGRVIGALLFLASEKDAFDEGIVRLLERMCENIAFALENFEREAERSRAEERLRESEERFRSLTSLLSDFYWETDAEHRFVMHSISGKPSTVFPAGTHIGKRRWELPYLSPDADGWRTHRAVLDAHRPFHDFRYSRATREGDERHFAISGEPIFDGGRFSGYRGIGRDITERVRAEAELRKLSGAIEQTADIVMITDRDGTIEYVNAAFARTTGYAETEAIGQRPSLLRSGAHDASFYARLWNTILAGETFSEVFVNRKKDGEVYYEERTISPLRDAEGNITHFIATGKDISERMQAQERLQHIAHHDALTGLPNRVLFLDRLEQALMRAHWQERMLGLMFLDLDRFKNVNDTLGHDTGDALLKAMAGRLRGCVRESDSVARLGGDEFAVLIEEVTHAEDVSIIARKILGAFGLPFAIQPHELFVTASIGIAMYPNDGTDAATLLKNADAAMYRAKDLGKNNYQFYSADLSAAAFERLRLESSLRRALERGEFVLHYQPQVDLASGRPIGVEALLRWQHPEFGLLSPTQFIAVAEETGAIVTIGEWVAREAMTQARRLRAGGLRQLRIAINVSGRQFNEPGFVETVARLLEETDLPPEALELEITESVLMSNVGKTAERLRALQAMGVRFAIDDFGTGYSSLSYLRRFPIQTLKIDKSFVRDISKSGGDLEIVKTIITMARGLNLNVVAEGVETREQLTFLRSHGCHAVQGYLLARPLPTEILRERLRDGANPSWLP